MSMLITDFKQIKTILKSKKEHKMSVAVKQQLPLSEYKLDYNNPKWDFIWAGQKKPKLNDELSQSLPKQWKYPMNRIIELKSMIDILDKNGIDTIQMVNNDTNELASIGIDVLKKDYSDRISILESLAKGDDKDSLNARAILYLANKFDYEKQNKNMKTSSFLSALFGTAQMINGIEKDNSNLNFSDKVTEENKENLNYFGRKMLELKEKPQSKEEFIADLKNHAKSNITKDEIVVLCKMFDLPKPPSLLNNEHKKLIKESLKLAVAYEKTKDFDESLKKEIQSVIDRKDNTPKKEKEKAKAKEADLGMGGI